MYAGKYCLLVLFSFIIFGNTYSQLAIFQDEDAIVTPNFQDGVIRAKKIALITLHFLSKPDGVAIRDDGIIQQYFFDTTGKLIESLYTVKSGSNDWDTVKCKYYYDNNNNISVKRTQIGDVYDTWYYKWYKENLVQTEAHMHETNALSTDGSFKIATQKIISADSFAYISYPKQLQQYGYNEDGKIFQKTITQYDDDKRFISRNYQYAVGWLYSQVDISYNASGQIIGYINTGNVNGAINRNTTIKYDSLGKMTEQVIFEDGKEKYRIEYMYDNETGLISNELDRDNDKALINIIRFSYEMYDNNNNTGEKKDVN